MIFGRYLLREFLKINTGLTGFFLMFYVIVDFLEKNNRFFSKNKVPYDIVLDYYASQLPKIFVDVIPFTVLFAAIITLWIFARSGEISAVRASGHSVFRLTSPLILLGLVFSAISFLVSEFVVPQTQLRLRYIETVKIGGKEFDPMFLESNWVRGHASILHFEKFDPIDMVLYNPQYYEFSSASTVNVFSYSNMATYSLSSHKWNLENAVLVSFDSNGLIKNTKIVSTFETSVQSEPPRVLRDNITSDQLSYRELRELIRLSKRSGGNLAVREIDLHQKISLRFASLLFVFFALPFALRKERQVDTYLHIIICLAAAIVYWIGNASMQNMAQNGLINPVLAAWLINSIFLVAIIVIIKKLD